jgi:simple sugar transport system permease protein
VVGLLAAVVVGAGLGLLHAFLSVTLRADQIVSATAINLVAAGLTAAMIPALWGQPGVSPEVRKINPVHVPWLRSLPTVGRLFSQLTVLDYAALALPVLVFYVLFRTPWGLRLRACGESPPAAASVGVNVIKMRYLAVVLSGVLAALGGVYLSLAENGLFQASMTQGRGFIALAAMIFGKWRPFPVLAACVVFGFADALQFRFQVIGLHVPHELLIALPYLLALVALATFVGRASAPAAIGQAYVKE